MKMHNTEYGLPIIHARAAGIDIGSWFHVVAVPTVLTEEPVQPFQAFTADLERMAAWLVELTTVRWSRQACIGYPFTTSWKPMAQVILANAGMLGQYLDAKLMSMHACGLLRASVCWSVITSPSM